MEENEDTMALFKRSNKPDGDDADDMVSFDDAAYAWWANRDRLEREFVPKKREVPRPGEKRHSIPTPPKESEFAAQYSTDSLFNWASSSEPDAPTHGGRGMSLDPYRVLGLQPGASLAEVVGAHRRLAKEYHPDRHHGTDEAEREQAAQEMSVINAAYQELRKRLMTHRHTV